MAKAPDLESEILLQPGRRSPRCRTDACSGMSASKTPLTFLTYLHYSLAQTYKT